MARRLPQLNALKAFEAAARHVSFTRAAEELCVTQGAVSHQVKALEAELGIKLFNRERQQLIITDAGRDYLGVVRDALDRLAMGTERLVQRQSSGMLTVSTSPDFAAKWLVHRLGRFAEAHPAIDLRVSATMHHVDFAREDVDLAVRHGDGDWPGLHVTRLCSEQLFAVCSPALGARLKRPKDLLKLPLLHLDERGPWTAWLEAAGVVNDDALHGPVLNRASMLIDAAIDGHGARAHHARGMGPHPQAPGAAVPGRIAVGEVVLDRLSEGDRGSAQAGGIPRLVVGAGARRRPGVAQAK
jgi:LysR family glycine cleavage system transcriptional activator